MAVIFVGDKPSSKNTSNQAFVGASCYARLLTWIAKMNISINDVYIYNKEHVGVYSFGGINFDDGHMYVDLGINDKVIAVGKEASKHLFHLGIPHHCLPHPSGLNRQVNDKNFIKEELEECKKFLEA